MLSFFYQTMDLSHVSKDTLISIIHDLQTKIEHYEKQAVIPNKVVDPNKVVPSSDLPEEYIDYRDTTKRLMYKGVPVYLGKDSPRQPNKKKLMCIIDGQSKQLLGGSGWNLWIKDDILYTLGYTWNNPSVYIIDVDIREARRWCERKKLMNEPYIKEIIRNIPFH
jgi:hypothetical protein